MRWIVLLTTAVTTLGCAKRPPETTTPVLPSQPPSVAKLTGKIAMVIASRDFRDEELQKPKAAFEAAGLSVDVVSSQLTPAKGMLGATVTPDKLLAAVVVDDYVAVVFVGGAGASEYWDDATAHSICNETLAKGKVLAAICLGPVTLARAGVLEGKQATVWKDNRSDLKPGGATLAGTNVHVVSAGKVVTGDGPEAAEEFGQAVLAALRAT